MSDPDSPPHGDYTAMTSSNSSGEEKKQTHNLGVSLQQFSYDSTGRTQPAGASVAQSSDAAGGGSSSPGLPESSASHVNFHNQNGDDALEDDEGGAGSMGGGSPNEEEVRLSPKEVRESSSREPSRLYSGGGGGGGGQQNKHVYPVPAAAGSSANLQLPSGPRHIAADSVASAAEPPAVVIAFINRHSGGKTGKAMAEELVKVLGPDNVFDLVDDKGPGKGLRKFKGTPNLRVVIGGGDGSINWVLSGMRAEEMTDVPAGCIPLGTGNDSSRAFGWGFKFPGARKVKKSVERMRQTRVEHFVRYDRWHAFAQYDRPVSDEFAQALPASLRPIHSADDIPTFYRHPKAIALPPVPDEKLRKQLPDSASAPRPYRAATIDRDAAAESYNVAAVPLEQRGDRDHHEHVELRKAAPPVTAEADADGDADAGPDGAPVREHGPGRNFGGEFNNYLSWGVDAQIQNSFHEAREGCRACFCCRPCNMAWMGCFGAVNFMTCMGKTLDASVEVRDEEGQWVDVPLPPGLRSLVLLNTPTYAGGRRLWGRDDPRKAHKPRKWECVSSRQSLDDGLFEIVGVYSTFHLGRIMISLDRGVRIAQVNEARITFRTPVHAQADGEPFLDQGNVTWHIRPLRPQLMMSRPDKMPKT